MKNLYVGNLAFSTTEEQIREMFQPYGAIEKINVVRDQDSGQPRIGVGRDGIEQRLAIPEMII